MNKMRFDSLLKANQEAKEKVIASGVQFTSHRLLKFIVVITLLQVSLRYVFNSPTTWSEEFSMLCLVWDACYLIKC